MDAAIQRWTGARFGLTNVANFTALLLTVVGRRSGEPRTVTLTYVRCADGYVVAGSNWGHQRHPEWSTNLLATPEATAVVRGKAVRVRARLAEGDERARLWALLAERWPGYDLYAEHVSREIRVFVLQPAE